MTPQYLFLPQTKVIISRSVKYCWVDCLVAKLSNAMHLLWTTLKKLVVWNVPTCTNCKWDNLSPLMQKKGQITPCRPTHSDQCNYSSFKKCQFWIPNRCFRNPINFILGTLFGLKEKELFTMCWISPLEPCPKNFGIPKMKLDFQNIDWEFISIGRQISKQLLKKLNKFMTICSVCDHCSLLKMQQFCSSAYIEQFGNPVLSSMGAIMNPFDLLLGGLAHGLHFCECLSIIVPHQFPQFVIQLLYYMPH